MDKEEGVFGLTSVQAFFVIILAVALVAYVIVTIMGTLQMASILADTLSGSETNESSIVGLTTTGFNFQRSNLDGVTCHINSVVLATTGEPITAGNWTQ